VEQDISEERAWLEGTLRSIGDAVIATDAHGLIRILNREATRLTGWTESEARGRPLSEVLRRVGEHGELLLNRSGEQIPIEHSSSPIVHDARGPLGVVHVFKDTSSTQRALAAAEERLRLAVAGAEIGMWDLDLATDRAIWNPTMYAILGVDFATPLTREVRRAHVHPDDAKLMLDTMVAARAERRSFGVEYRAIRQSDQSLRWLSVRGKYIYDERGEVTRVLGVVLDITERRNLEARVRQAQRLDALGTLAGGIAHDFNNIIAVLRGSLDALEQEIPPEGGGPALLAHMTQACSRATDLVRQILAFARQQEQDRRVVDLKPVLQEALQLLRSTLPRTLEIDAKIPDDLPTILADAGQLNQVIMNLGINASQAMENRTGQISVSVDVYQLAPGETQLAREIPPGKYLRVSFSDTGKGMTREVAEHIFEPFFTTKPKGQGTGLGLSVVQGVMKNHEGAITVYSEVGRGTRFHLYFPVLEDAVPQAPPTLLETPPGQGERILYLDDEAALVSLTTRLLQRMGYQPSGFTDAQEALAAFTAAPDQFDLVVTDMAMPRMSGIDFAQQVLAVRPDIPVLLASGYVRPEEVERAREAGIRKVIWKPSTLSEMGLILREELARAIHKAPP
jgi:PAS domain S-box-containing protein